jgi:hypothetical protein
MCHRSRHLPDKQKGWLLFELGRSENAHRPDGLTAFLGDAVVGPRPDGPSSLRLSTGAQPSQPVIEWPRQHLSQAPLHKVHSTSVTAQPRVRTLTRVRLASNPRSKIKPKPKDPAGPMGDESTIAVRDAERSWVGQGVWGPLPVRH